MNIIQGTAYRITLLAAGSCHIGNRGCHLLGCLGGLAGILSKLLRKGGYIRCRPLDILNQPPQVADGLPVGSSQLAHLIGSLRLRLHSKIAAGNLPGNIHEIVDGIHDTAAEIYRHKAGKHNHQQGADNQRPLGKLILIGSRYALLEDKVLAAVHDSVQLGRNMLIPAD